MPSEILADRYVPPLDIAVRIAEGLATNGEVDLIAAPLPAAVGLACDAGQMIAHLYGSLNVRVHADGADPSPPWVEDPKPHGWRRLNLVITDGAAFDERPPGRLHYGCSISGTGRMPKWKPGR